MSKDFLVLRFSPSKRFLSAVWQRPVSSEEYRHGIRTIAVCITTLRVQYALTDLSGMGTPSVKDQYCTASFLKQALTSTTLRRSARVLSQNKNQWIAYERVLRDSQGLSYETRVFESYDQATVWLFEGQAIPDDMVPIPMPFSASELRRQLNNGTFSGVPRISTAAPANTNTTVCQTDFVKIVVDRTEGLLTVRWLRPVESREYRYGVLKAARALQLNKLEKMLINNQRLGIPALDDQRWLCAVSINVLSRCRLKRMAIISSHDTLQQITNETVGKKVKNANIAYQSGYFLCEDEALEWLGLEERVLHQHPNQ